MSFEERQQLPAIEDIDFKTQPGWYRFQVTVARDIEIERLLAEVETTQPSLEWSARAQLGREIGHAWDNFAAVGDALGTTAVLVPPGQSHVVCTTYFRINGANGPDWSQASPENYEKELAKPDSDSRVHVDTVGVWRDEFSTGTCVTAYFLMHYHDAGRKWTEERVSSGYFPHGSSQMIALAFTTPAVGANGDSFAMLVREMMQSMTVKLDR